MLFNGLLFFVHYKDSSATIIKNRETTSYHQEIEIVHRANELFIRHHFTDLPPKRLEINWPSASEDRTCHAEDSDSCLRLNEDATAFVEGEETSQSISYRIPKSGDNAPSFWQSIFAKIHEATPQGTVLHIADEVHEDGMWITGLPQVGNQTLNLVNYTLFSGTGPVADLYWQQQRMASEQSDYVTVYGDQSPEIVEQLDELFSRFKAPHIDIVLNEEDRNIASSRFVITNPMQLNHALQQFAVQQFYTDYADVSVDRFTAEVITALILGDEFDLGLASQAVSQLTDSLGENQVAQFAARFKDKTVDLGEAETIAEVADDLIEEITRYQTAFFTRNSQLEEGFFSFLLESPKKLIVANGNPLEKHTMKKDNKTYYPIKEIMEELAYDVSLNDHSLYIESVEKDYRFPFDSHFYVYNDRRFNTKTISFERINGDVYFEEAAMLRIFQMNIEVSEDEIRLTPIGS